METIAKSFTIPLFISRNSAYNLRPFSFEKKEQAEVGQSPTFCPYAAATGLEAFSGNALFLFRSMGGIKRIPCEIPIAQKI